VRLRVLFIHYHLRPGGVTRVILDQIKAIKEFADTAIIIGEEPQVRVNCPYRVVSPISYDRDRRDNLKPTEIAELIIKEAQSIWSGGPDIIHVHNPTLGKNKDFLEVLFLLEEKNRSLLLQIHDFAEDGRPGGYSSHPYPHDVHYAVINSRDYGILLKSGLQEDGLHYLPNAIHPLPISDNIKRDLYLYPVRAIRRKNVGEAILLSLFIKEGCHVGITLEPTSRIDTVCYNNWIHFSRERGLRVKYALGLSNKFEDIVSRALLFITTSVKEGFGFSFLEPWTAMRMVSGRLIPDVCSDFIEKNIILDSFYNSIKIPLEMIDVSSFENIWIDCYKNILAAYGIKCSDVEAREALSDLYVEDTLDYSYLNEELQMEVIENLQKNKKKLEKFLDLNPFFKKNSDFNNGYTGDVFDEVVKHNREVVLKEYSIEKYSRRLRDIYENVLNYRVSQSINKKKLLDAFLKPENQYLLLCEKSAGLNSSFA